MHVEMRLRMFFPVRRGLVYAGGVRKRDPEEVVIPDGDAADDIRELIALLLAHSCEAPVMAPAHNDRLEGPDRPERDDHRKTLVHAHDPLGELQLERDVIAQEATAPGAAVGEHPARLLRRFDRDSPLRPDLAVRMRIAAPHHRSLVLEYLDMPYVWEAPERSVFLGEHINNVPCLLPVHLCERAVVTGGKAYYAADAGLPFGEDQAPPRVSSPRVDGRSDPKSLSKTNVEVYGGFRASPARALPGQR